MKALINETMVMELLAKRGESAHYYNVNPGILTAPASERKVPVWYILAESGRKFYYKFRSGEIIEFPDAGDFAVLNQKGMKIEFPDGEKFRLCAYELVYKKSFEPDTGKMCDWIFPPLKVYDDF